VLIWPEGAPSTEIWALGSTLVGQDGWTIFRRYGQRWWLQNRGNRELKEAYGLERDLWS